MAFAYFDQILLVSLVRVHIEAKHLIGTESVSGLPEL